MLSKSMPEKKQDSLNEQEEYLAQLRQHGQKYIIKAIALIGILLFAHSIILLFNIEKQDPSFMRAKLFGAIICAALIWLLYYEPRITNYVPFIVCFFGISASTDAFILKFPEKMTMPGSLLSITTTLYFLNQSLMISVPWKNMSNILVVGVYLLKCYLHYGLVECDIVTSLVVYLLISNEASKQYQSYFNKISELYFHKSQVSKENFLKTLDILPQGVILIDLKDQQISYCNEECFSILNIKNMSEIRTALELYYKSDRISQQSSQTLILQDIHKSCKQPLNLFEHLNNVKPHIKKSFGDLIFKNKQLNKYFQVKTQFINQNQQVLAILNDITRIKSLESQSKKMKSMFFASVAHELRTPLNSIIPLTKRLQQLIKDEHSLKLINIIKNSSIFLQHIIEDALDISRLENNKFQLFEEYFDLRQAVNEVADIMDFQIQQKSLKLQIEISDRIPELIKTDQKRLMQVLFNLIGNAIKFTFKGSITIRMNYQNNIIKTEVIDTGIGIKPENLDQLFKFFGQIHVSTKVNRGGMGFGLTISKLIIQQLKGDITVNSEYQKGTTFSFEIPFDDSSIRPVTTQSFIEEEQKQSSFSSQVKKPIQSESFITSFSFRSSEIEEDFMSKKFEELHRQGSDYQKNMRNFEILSSGFSSGPSNILRVHDDKYIQLRQRMKVLIVDDSPYNLFVLQELTSQIEEVKEIQTALNGKEAIEKMLLVANASGSHFIRDYYDFILMDLHMPVMDGFQAIKSLRDLQKERRIDLHCTRVIAVSAITFDQFKNSLHSELFDAFMEKPVNFDLLSRLLKS